MFFKRLEVGPMGVNCYIIAGGRNHGMVIDPGDDGENILKIIEDNNVTLKYIVLTHGHFDHIGAVRSLKEHSAAEIAIHSEDAVALTDPVGNLSALIGESSVQPGADRLLKDGDVLEFDELAFKVIHTPGHTPGGICLLCGRMLFSGDTLFNGSVGRTDLPGGNMVHLVESIKSRLMVLDENIQVYPGHGSETSVGREKSSNPFI